MALRPRGGRPVERQVKGLALAAEVLGELVARDLREPVSGPGGTAARSVAAGRSVAVGVRRRAEPHPRHSGRIAAH